MADSVISSDHYSGDRHSRCRTAVFPKLLNAVKYRWKLRLFVLINGDAGLAQWCSNPIDKKRV
jgi:hypothetical protein